MYPKTTNQTYFKEKLEIVVVLKTQQQQQNRQRNVTFWKEDLASPMLPLAKGKG